MTTPPLLPSVADLLGLEHRLHEIADCSHPTPAAHLREAAAALLVLRTLIERAPRLVDELGRRDRELEIDRQVERMPVHGQAPGVATHVGADCRYCGGCGMDPNDLSLPCCQACGGTGRER